MSKNLKRLYKILYLLHVLALLGCLIYTFVNPFDEALADVIFARTISVVVFSLLLFMFPIFNQIVDES